MGVAGLLAVLLIAAIVGVIVEQQERTRLARNARLVVRVPLSVVERLTDREIRQEFPFQEEHGEFTITGTAHATGHVSFQLQPHNGRSHADDVLITVRVEGTTEQELLGRGTGIQIVGDGQGTFVATKPVCFDGQQFREKSETEVVATHETEIVRLESLEGTPLEGPTKFLTSRRAREALPVLNKVAEQRIEKTLREIVERTVAEGLARLNEVQRIDETLAHLHPHAQDWRVRVSATDQFLQAALIPDGAPVPPLPAETPPTLEVWMKLTRSQRAGLKILGEWRVAHRLFRRFVPAERAARIRDDVTVANVGDWTRVRIAERAWNDTSTDREKRGRAQIVIAVNPPST
jgi:hypothetical protein